MADDSQPQPDAPPPPPQAQPPPPAVVPASGGAVNLHDPFFRQLESDRGLPPGILSAMAEKESGGNALKVNPSRGSTASGLFQITAPSARAFGLSADERFDPIKSATAVADTLARRADQYGIERAVGMHYGGPGTPFTQTVGTSGLSPAQYAGDVIRRSAKYGGAVPEPGGALGYSSPSFDDSPRAQYAQPQGQEQQFYRQYLQSTAPDGSTTIREIVSPNLLDDAAAVEAEKRAGYTFQNFVEPSRMAAVPPAQATPPQPAQAEAPVLPSAVVPTSGAVPSSYSAAPGQPDPWAQWHEQMPDAVARPHSSPWYNLIPPAMSVAGPLALSIAQPEIGIPLWLASGGLAALGGAGGEGVREYMAGGDWSPRNIATQGVVSGLTDVGMNTVVNPYILGPMARGVTGKLGKVTQAAEDLGPVLTSTETTAPAPAASVPAPAPPLRVTSLNPVDLAKSTPETMQVLVKQATEAERPALASAWVAARRAEALTGDDPIGYMRDAYKGLGPETQQALFGPYKAAYERLLNSAWGGTPGEISSLVQSGVGETTATGAVGAGMHYAGLPLHVPTTAVGLRTLADFSAPFAARGMLVSPSAARFGANLSSFGNVAGPAMSTLAAQTAAERARQGGAPVP